MIVFVFIVLIIVNIIKDFTRFLNILENKKFENICIIIKKIGGIGSKYVLTKFSCFF